MSNRHHIPFPSNFLSLNSRVTKHPGAHDSSTNNNVVASPDADAAPHSFLSNRSPVPRHASISSVSSSSSGSTANSAVGPPSSPQAKPADSPLLEPKVPAFLALNSKFAAPKTTAKEMRGEKGGFLSNRG